MDECLVHTEVADATIKGCHTHSTRPHELSPADLARRPPADFEFELPYLDAPVRVFKRPALDEFLAETSKLADIVLYTSAVEGYASEIIRRIDPDGTTFLRLLSRKHCRVLEHTGGAPTPRRHPHPRVLTHTRASAAAYGKDLRGLGRSLARTVLVDDSNTSFMLQPDNGIPISAFYGDPRDRGLVEARRPHATAASHPPARRHCRCSRCRIAASRVVHRCNVRRCCRFCDGCARQTTCARSCVPSLVSRRSCSASCRRYGAPKVDRHGTPAHDSIKPELSREA